MKNNNTKLIINKLKSKKEEELIFTIKQMRHRGNAIILPHLFDMLIVNKSENVRKEAVKLLNDLKDESCKIEIIKAIKDEKYRSLRKELVSSCWQSSIDFSSELAVFVDVFKKADFETAFEAFTVIDNLKHDADLPNLTDTINDLKQDIARFKGSDKEQLYVELVHILEHFRSE